VKKSFESMPTNVQCAIVDIDVSFDLYAHLKSKKIVSAIPTILFYTSENTSYVPDDIYMGTDQMQLTGFFERCRESALE